MNICFLQVNFTQYMNNIESFDIATGELLVSGFFEVIWRDELLTWDPAVFGGKQIIPLPKEMVWKPELSPSDVHDYQGDLISSSAFCIGWLTYQGIVVAAPAGNFKTTCIVDTTSFPFDKHECAFQFFVYNHDASEIMLLSPSGGLIIDSLKENGEWMVQNTKVTINILNAETIETLSITMLEASFTLKRRPSFEIINTFAHFFLMIFLNTLTCFIRPDSGERLSFAVTLYLSLAFASSEVIGRFPNNSLKMPYVSYEMLIINIINTATVAWSIFIVLLAGRQASELYPLPMFLIKYVIEKRKTKARASKNISPEYTSETSVEVKEDHGKETEDLHTNGISGQEVAKTLDKIYFIFVVALTVVVTTAFMTINVFSWVKS